MSEKALNEEEIKFRAYLLILNSEFPTHRKTEAMEELLKIYNKQQKEIKRLRDIEKDYIRRMRTSNAVLLKQGYINKEDLKEIIYPTPENPISIEIQSSEIYKKLQELLGE